MTRRHRLSNDSFSSADEQYVIMPLPEAPPSHEAAANCVASSVAFSCEYEGAIGGSTGATSVFRLRVLHNATLEGEVLKPRVAHNSDKKKKKRPKLTTTMTRPRVQETRSMAAGRDGLVVFAHVQGRVKSLSSHREEAAHLRIDDSYCCYFDILPDSTQSEEDTLTCHVHFSPAAESDLQGQWILHREKPFWITRDAPCELYYQEIKQQFQLKRRIGTTVKAEQASGGVIVKQEDHHVMVKTEEEPQKQNQQNAGGGLKLYPLTPGLYEFRGFTTIAPPPPPRPSRTMTTSSRASPSRCRRRSSSTTTQPAALSKDECFVTLRLLPDRTVEGISRELLRPQSCPVSGTWRIDCVQYVLEYKVRDAVGLFRYSGRIEGDRKILGKWQNVDEGHQEGYDGGKGEFELELTQAVRQSVVKKGKRAGSDDNGEMIVITDDEDEDNVSVVTKNKIRALTTGQYTLKGCATDDDGYEYACELVVELFAGGVLKGFSRELIFDQTHMIEGKWSSKCMSYDQKYIVKGDVGEYFYNGTIDSEGGIISGEWENAEPQDKEMRGEKGMFAYGIVEARRVWSVFSHRNYPTTFQDAVMLILLWSSRTHALPNSLWFRVFEFCHESWFAVVKKR